jgi:hypothetical protein
MGQESIVSKSDYETAAQDAPAVGGDSQADYPCVFSVLSGRVLLRRRGGSGWRRDRGKTATGPR